MTDWATISSLATAGGTLVLAVATFSSVRSNNRAARTAERALLAGLRPVLMPTRLDDPAEKVMWVDRHWAKVEGGLASVEAVDDNIYLAMSLRNVGAGIAVLQGWDMRWPVEANILQTHADPDTFRRQSRDLYVPVGNIGFWQGAVRDHTDPMYSTISNAIEQREPFVIDLLYTDHEGGQRAISRFTVNPRHDSGWISSVARHWNLDRADPR
jgi:hypothetical protein